MRLPKILGFCCLVLNLTGQSPNFLENQANRFIPNDPSILLEREEELFREKIFVNFCSLEDLVSSGVFDLYQINNLLQYRERGGKIYSLVELAQIKGFSPSFLKEISPLLDFSTQPPRPKLYAPWLKKYNQHEIYWRWSRDLQERRGYKEQKYLGDPWESSLRYRYQNGRHLRAGLQLQKDPGEAWTGEGRFLSHDHSSFFIEGQANAIIRKVILGDFKYDFGQGLCLSSGGMAMVNAQEANLKLYPKGPRAYAGADENQFFRGLAINSAYKSWQLKAFYSVKYQDASIDSLEEQAIVLNPNRTGLHRTEAESALINQERRHAWALDISFENQLWQMGVLAFQEKRRANVPNTTFQTNDFKWSGHWNYLKKGFNFYGEIVANQKLELNSIALISGIQTSLSSKSSIAFSYYLMGHQVQSNWQANPNLLKGVPGEKGFKLQFNQRWQGNQMSVLGLQESRYSLPSYLNEGPGRQLELFGQHLISYGEGQFQIRAFHQNSSFYQNQPDLKELRKQKKQRTLVRLSNSGPISAKLKLKLNLSFSQSSGTTGIRKGLLMGMALVFRSQKWDLKGGIAYSNINNWDSRIYLYEYDLPYSFSIPAFGGKALRHHLLISCRVFPWMKISIKHEAWLYFDRINISNSWQQIEGNRQNRLKMAFLIKL